MWALVESGSVSKVYTQPKSITVGDIQYPSNIFMLWTSSELEAIGIYEVVVDDTNYKDPKYYINTDQSFAFSSGTVKATYGTATAKPLDDSTDDDGVVTRGLKYIHCENIRHAAYGLLQPNDWMVVRNAESSKAIPSDWLDYRVAVRTAASSMKTKINAVSTVDALAALYVYNDATPPVRPLGEFPDAPSS
jgi:hypothetical protein